MNQTDSFTDALDESLEARLYTGNHFPFTLEDSRDMGHTIGDHVLNTPLQPVA